MAISPFCGGFSLFLIISGELRSSSFSKSQSPRNRKRNDSGAHVRAVERRNAREKDLVYNY